jgi:hypothetical protein
MPPKDRGERRLPFQETREAVYREGLAVGPDGEKFDSSSAGMIATKKHKIHKELLYFRAYRTDKE